MLDLLAHYKSQLLKTVEHPCTYACRGKNTFHIKLIIKLYLCYRGGLILDPYMCSDVSFRRKLQLRNVIQNYKPDTSRAHQARVLLVGPVGAGKSSFFNSINSAFRGNMTSQAIAGTAGKSVTTQVLETCPYSVILKVILNSWTYSLQMF